MNRANNDWQQFLSHGDVRGFAAVYEAMRDEVWTICVRVLVDEDEALDAFQGTWNRLLDAARNQKPMPGAEMKQAVRAMAWREAERVRGARRRRKKREAAMPDQVYSMPSPRKDQRSEAAERELRAKLELLVQLLPDRYRVPVQLHYLHGMSYAEIAAMIGKPVSTVSTQISRGVGKLQALAAKAGIRDVTAALGAMAATGVMLSAPAKVTAASAFAAATAASISSGTGTSLITSLAGAGIMKSKGALIGALLVLLLITGAVFWNTHETSPAALSATQDSNENASIEQANAINPAPEVAEPETPVVVGEKAEEQTPTNVVASTTEAQPTPQPAAVASDEMSSRTIIFGTVYTQDGAPAPDSTVWAFMTEFAATTDDDGKYEMEVHANDLMRHLSEMSRVGLTAAREDYRSATRGGISLKWGKRNGPFDLRLNTRGRMLTVLVTNNGEPIKEANVLLQDGRSQTTGEDGTVRFEALAAGEWQVEASAPGFARVRKTASLLAQEDALLEVALVPGGTVFGIVRDDKGNAIEGVEYGYYQSGPLGLHRSKMTTADGQYRLDHLPLRGADVQFMKEGYPPESITGLEFKNGVREIQRDVVMGNGLSIRGRVVNAANSAPISGARVTFEPDGNMAQGMTGTDGTFELTGLSEANPADLLVEAKGFAPSHTANIWSEVQVLEGNGELVIKMEPGMWIRGRVVDAKEKPVAGVWICPLIRQPRAGNIYLTDKTTTTADGTFFFDSLSEDVVFDFVPSNGFADIRDRQLRLNQNDVVVMLSAFRTARGHVLDAKTKKPVKQFNIRLSGGYEVSRVHKGANFDTTDGAFMLKELNPGEQVMVTVTAEGYVDKKQELLADGSDEVILMDAETTLEIEGKVLDSTGNGVPGAQLYLIHTPVGFDRHPVEWGRLLGGYPNSNGTRTSAAQADAAGRFVLRSVPTDGVCDVAVYAGGFGRTVRENIPRDGNGDGLVVELAAPATVQVTVKKEDFVKPEAVELRRDLWKSGRELGAEFMGIQRLETNAVVQGDLEPGNYEVRLWGGEWRDPLASVMITVGAGERKEVLVEKPGPAGE